MQLKGESLEARNTIICKRKTVADKRIYKKLSGHIPLHPKIPFKTPFVRSFDLKTAIPFFPDIADTGCLDLMCFTARMEYT
ncbi:hypothetical protein CEXT_39001 [Caerostris extrusa]|uniref:Uncharacterized protein n=1 Tax=Caerostris extrusa TaxID=172846 RepID=A0AAV4T080_CAEEX|nr:hypothetical protein CEXT_39001 [Caerostris extrusa]